MAALSSANMKYTAEELAKVSGISAETMANWGLTQSTDTLTMSQLAELASSDAQAKKVLEKIIAQNAQKVANGEITASNISLAASEGTATLATGSFTTAIKANISAMWTWMKTTPLGWLTLLASGVFVAVKAYDIFTTSVEEQREAMENSVSEYEEAQTALSNTTTELENQEQAMDDLLAKEKLTYAEKGQLEELKQITAELRIQKDLNEKNVDKTKREAAIDASKLFKKQFGDYEISESKMDEYRLDDRYHLLISDENDISGMLVGYERFMELRKQAFEEGDQYDIDHFTGLTDDLKESIFETAQELQTQKDAISDYYETLKNTPYDSLTSEQKEVVDSYNSISNAIALIYKQLDPQTWNSMQLTDVFATERAEKTKEELIEMAKAGTLDEKTIQSYTNLNKALEGSNLVLEDGKTAVSAFCDEIYAMAGVAKTTTENHDKMTVSLSDLADASDKISSLSSAFKELSDDGYITTETIAKVQEATGLSGVEWDNYQSKLMNAKKGSAEFNQVMSDLTFRIIDSKFNLEELKDATEAECNAVEKQIAATLRENGVTNANAVAQSIVAQAKKGLKIAYENLTYATHEEINALIDEGIALGYTSEQMFNLIGAHNLLNNSKLNLEDKIAVINSLGDAGLIAAYKVAYLIDLLNSASNIGRTSTVLTDGDRSGAAELDLAREFGVFSSWNKIDIPEFKMPDFSGASSGVSGNWNGSGSDNTPDYEDPTDAIINRINLRADELAQKEEEIQNLIEIAELENDYKKQISLTNDLIDKRKERLTELENANWWHNNEAEYQMSAHTFYNEDGTESDEHLWFDSQGNATEYYNSLLNKKGITKEEQEQIKDLFNRISKYKNASMETLREIKNINSQIIKDSISVANIWEESADDSISDIEHNIEMRNNAGNFDSEADISDLRKIQDIAHQRAEDWRNAGYGEDSEEIQKWQKIWRDAQNSIVDKSLSQSEQWINERNKYGDWEKYGDNEVDAWKRVLERFKSEYPNELDEIARIEESLFDARKKQMEDDLNEVDKYIDARNTYNNWDEYADDEVSAIRRKMEIIKDYYEQGILSSKEYNDTIKELNQKAYQVGKDSLLSSVEKIISDYENTEDKKKKSKELKSSKLNSMYSLLQSHYNVLNDISAAHHEINKELEASKTMYEYLDKDTRKLLFNQEDYNRLSEELNNIQKKAEDLQRNYIREINKAKKENLEKVTSEYQMQYKTLMKSYEIAKADLEVAKKKQKLNNVLNERNVRMFVDGRWQWVANTQDVINAQNELAEAEYQKEQSDNSLSQTLELNKLQTAQDELATEINTIDTHLEEIHEKWNMLQQEIEGQSQTVAGALSSIAQSDAPMLQNILLQSGQAIADFVKSITGDVIDVPTPYLSYVDYAELMKGVPKDSSLYEFLNKQRNAKIKGMGLSYKPFKPFASGTRFLPPGNALMGESGSELYIDAGGHTIPIGQPTMFTDLSAGGLVFNKELLDGARAIWDMSHYSKSMLSNMVGSTPKQSIDNSNSNNVIINGMTVDSGSQNGKELINALRRYTGTH